MEYRGDIEIVVANGASDEPLLGDVEAVELTEILVSADNLNAKTLSDLPGYAWQILLKTGGLSTNDVIALRRSNGPIRRHLNHIILSANSSEVSDQLRKNYDEWREQQTNKDFMLDFKTYTSLCISAILFSSLSIDNFQVPFHAAFLDIADKVVATGSYCARHQAINLPAECGQYAWHSLLTRLSSHVNHLATNGPAQYWWASFGSLVGFSISADVYSRYTYKDNPLAKIVSGSACLVSGALSMLIPFFSDHLEWPTSSAVTLACNTAYDNINFAFTTAMCPTRFNEVIFKSVDAAAPLIPALARIPGSEYLYPALGITACLSATLFFNSRRKKNTERLEFDLNNELPDHKQQGRGQI